MIIGKRAQRSGKGVRGVVPFEVIEHTADTGIRAYGASLPALFRNCALGMMSLMLDPGSVDPSQAVSLEATGSDLQSLLVSWLSEILFQVEAEDWAFADFEVSEMSETRISGFGKGELLDPERHGLKSEIKAATYHMLELKQRDGGWAAQVIFDV